MVNTIDGWIQKYKETINEPFHLLPNFTLMTNHEHGFVMYRICGDVMWVTQCCGHQSYWHPVLSTIAKAYGCKTFKTTTVHNPKLFARIFKMKQEFQFAERSGVMHYIFTKEVE